MSDGTLWSFYYAARCRMWLAETVEIRADFGLFLWFSYFWEWLLIIWVIDVEAINSSYHMTYDMLAEHPLGFPLSVNDRLWSSSCCTLSDDNIYTRVYIRSIYYDSGEVAGAICGGKSSRIRPSVHLNSTSCLEQTPLWTKSERTKTRTADRNPVCSGKQRSTCAFLFTLITFFFALFSIRSSICSSSRT